MRKIGIYVHIPFCKKKCKYCDFISFENLENAGEYVNRVIYDIENIEEILKENNIGEFSKDILVDTIYFGGGTPSIIDSKYIAKILRSLRKKFNVEKNAEITIEVNPGTVSYEKLKAYFDIGINRLSIGLQSTNNNLLKLIGRIHTYEDFLETYKMAREIGFKNINVDLIIGLPTQNLEDVILSLNNVMDLNPEHISVYSLILEENTELEREVKEGNLTLPDEKIERQMYHEVKKTLEKSGYIHYEISNFCKKNYESKHNLNCWKQHEYLGFGLASHSYFNNFRFSNLENFKKYIEKNNEQVYNKRVVIYEKQTKEDTIKEYMLLMLRLLNGVNQKDFEEKFNLNPKIYFKDEISKLEKLGLLEITENQIKLSLKGLDFANIVFEEFV